MSRRKSSETTLHLTREDSQVTAIITVGGNEDVEQQKKSRDDASKPLYLRRV